MMIEAIGLAAPGQGAALTKSGATAIGGATPVNTGGLSALVTPWVRRA